MKVLIVTGTPATGKTTLSKKLAKKLNFHYLDVNKVIKKYNISEGYDRKRKTKVVDIKKLNRALINEIGFIKKNPIKKYNSIINSSKKYSDIAKKTIKNKKHPKISNKTQKNQRFFVSQKFNEFLRKIKNGIIIDSHLSHYLPKQYADLCIVAKCDLKVLKNRLKRKKYPENKIRENLDAEIFDICLNEAKEHKHKIFVINTTKGINIKTISNKIGGLIDIK